MNIWKNFLCTIDLHPWIISRTWQRPNEWRNVRFCPHCFKTIVTTEITNDF